MIAVFDIQNARMGDIAYRVNPEYWNRGITTEALKEVVRFIFENTELTTLCEKLRNEQKIIAKAKRKAGMSKPAAAFLSKAGLMDEKEAVLP